MISVSGNTSRGAWTAIESAAAPISALAISAGLTRALGAADFGVLVTVLAISNLSMAINPAIAAATTKLISESNGSANHDDWALSRITTASFSVILIFGICFVLTVMALGGVLPDLLFGRAFVEHHMHLRPILILAVLVVCVQQLDGVFGATLRGLERFKQQALFEVGSRGVISCL
jgi:O-antigen/teichoic acid export membrane protein